MFAHSKHDTVKFQDGCPSAFNHALTNIGVMLSHIDGLQILLRINYTGNNIDVSIVDAINSFISCENRKKVEVILKKVWQEQNDRGRSHDLNLLIDKFRNSGYRASFAELNLGFLPCYASRKYYNAIVYDGKVVKCTANDDLFAEPVGALGEDGIVRWQDGIEKCLYRKNFENGKCLSCKYLPVCMGMCTRNYTTDDYTCKLQCRDYSMDDIIADYVNYNEQ